VGKGVLHPATKESGVGAPKNGVVLGGGAMRKQGKGDLFL